MTTTASRGGQLSTRKGEWNELWPSHWFSGMTDFSPSTDVKEMGDKIVIHTELPGVKKEDVNINLENGYLTIR